MNNQNDTLPPKKVLSFKNHLIISAIFGFCAVLISPVNYTIVGIIQPNYSLFNQTISELGAFGAPSGVYISISFFLSGVFEALFATALYPALKRTKWAFFGALMICFSGIFNSTFSGIFPLGSSFTGFFHDLFSLIGECAMIIAPFLLFIAMHDKKGEKNSNLTKNWNIIRKITLIVGFLFILMVILDPIAQNFGTGIGFVQRIGDFAYYIWILCISIKFFQIRKTDTK